MKRPTVFWPLTLLSVLIIVLSIFTEKSNWHLSLIGVGVIIGLAVLDIYTPKISRLSASDPKVKTMRRLNRFFILFFTLIFVFLIWYPDAGLLVERNENGLAFILTIVIMGVVGNTAPKLPFNRYMGLRLPWTIRDEETWIVAHKWLGFITLPIILLIIMGYFFNVELDELVKYGILLWIAIPGLYSGWVYHKRMG